MATKSYSNLVNGGTVWNQGLRNFAITTVMNAKVYGVYDGMLKTEYTALTPTTLPDGTTLTTLFESIVGNEATKIDFSALKANEIIALYLATEPISELKYLKNANSTEEGPSKTVTGGQNASPLVKYGKTARLEITDALGNAEALEALSGITVEYFRTTYHTPATLTTGATDVIHASTGFAGPKTIIGDTFIVDAKTGQQIGAYIIFYDFLPDSLFNLTQDAEGDATVFDMNGDLIETKILIGDMESDTITKGGDEDGVVTGVFYSMLPKLDYVKDFDVIVGQ